MNTTLNILSATFTLIICTAFLTLMGLYKIDNLNQMDINMCILAGVSILFSGGYLIIKIFQPSNKESE